MKNLKLKSDKYRKSRGGYSRFLDIYCSNCRHKILVYQKDGSGELKRLYLDRIVFPERLVKSTIRFLACTQCGQELGIFHVYPKEKRPAFRLFVGSVQKKINKR